MRDLKEGDEVIILIGEFKGRRAILTSIDSIGLWHSVSVNGNPRTYARTWLVPYSKSRRLLSAIKDFR